jgi:outer membrane autotransporter protein
MTGTSDLNYTYTFANSTITGPTSGYNFMGLPTTVSGQTTTTQPASQLLVDTQLGAPGSSSDRLVVGGNVGGLTEIKVNDVNPGPGGFNPVGITVVKVEGTVASGSSSTAFNIDPTTPGYIPPGIVFNLGAIQKGAFVYPLIYNGANDPAYMLFGLPGPFLLQAPVFAAAAQNIFDATTDGWYDRQEETRNCMRHGFAAAGLAHGGGADLAKAPPVQLPQCEPGVWTKLIGSWTHQNGFVDLAQLGPLFSGMRFDTSFHQGTGGVMVGLDYGFTDLASRTDSLVLSIMGGYINSMVNFNSPNAFSSGSPLPPSDTSLTFSGGTVAGSATYMNGGFFADALLKADFLSMNIGNIPGNFCSGAISTLCNQSAQSTTWGVLGDIGYRFELGRYFIEPIATVEWARNHIDNVNLVASAVTVEFGNNDMLNVGGGLRGGGVIMDDRVHYLDASIIGRVWDRATDNPTVNFVNLGPSFRLSENFQGVYGEAAIQLDWLNRFSGWSAYLRADAKFNDQFQTFTGNLGVRYGF